MRTPYPLTTNRQTLYAVNSARTRATGNGFSMLAIEQIVRLPGPRGAVATRMLKILRLDEAPSPVEHPVNPRITQRQTFPSAPAIRFRRELIRRTPEQEVLEHRRNQEGVGLRRVGEVVTDEAGVFYEVVGQELRPLGKLVSDERGRIFEVDDATHEWRNGGTNAAMKGARTRAERADPNAVRTRTTETTLESPRVSMRTEIPEQYMNPLQFKYSREEVLYDMKGLLGTLPPDAGRFVRWLIIYPARLAYVLVIAIVSGRRIKKWRAMLAGKSRDEQLWAVTPPHRFSHDPAVRGWAEETLAKQGYDPKRMLEEWEVFWRRKGIS